MNLDKQINKEDNKQTTLEETVLNLKTNLKTNLETNLETNVETNLETYLEPYLETNKEHQTIQLNKEQLKASNYIKEFLEKKDTSFLLLGPAGTGKTSTIINVFNNSLHKIAFCAFTNKATQVLKNAGKKFQVNFHADFETIHTLLALEPIYGNNYDEIKFKFDINKVDNLKKYTVIIFDECSTIPQDLFNYIYSAHEYIKFKHGKDLKFIFLGDFWQLPPVNEATSVVFDQSIKSKWPVSKLTTVMRSNNDLMKSINNKLLEWVEVFRKPNQNKDLYYSFMDDYPYCILDEQYGTYLGNYDDLVDKYMNVWKRDSDVVILTYSKSNASKLNQSVQTRVDINRFLQEDKQKKEKNKEKDKEDGKENGKEDKNQEDNIDKLEKIIQRNDDNLLFHAGDRCCLERPIEISSFTYSQVNGNTHVKINKRTGEHIYNGEIFDVIHVNNVKCETSLNRFINEKTFDAQILSMIRINDPDKVVHDIVYIPWMHIKNNIPKIKAKLKNKDMFNLIMSEFCSLYARLTYGYAITIYKAQGSEWHTTLVNLSSIKYSIAPTNDVTKNKQLFKTTYTALTRATNQVYTFYFR